MKSRLLAYAIAFSILAGCASGGSGPGNAVLPNSTTQSAKSAEPGSAIAPGFAEYAVTDLGTLGGSASSGNSINGLGMVAGQSNLSGDSLVNATLWNGGHVVGLGTLGGPNSAVQWPNHNNFGLIAGIAETEALDPLNEAWSCSAFFLSTTHHVCLGFVSRDGTMRPLPTLGGINGYAAGTNDWGQVVGWAENTTHDSTCTGSQVLQFEPVLWQPDRRIRQLPTLPGDPDGAATAINDLGQIVGISGICDQAVGRLTAEHAVIWDRGGVTNLGTLGGTAWNTPTAINNLGEVVGFANIPGGDPSALHPQAFLWTRAHGIVNLKTLPGDAYSFAEGINDRGQVVGVSYSAGFATARAFIWQNGVMRDLNSLLSSGSSLDLIEANDINDSGVITGEATIAGTTQSPAFLATPKFGFGIHAFDAARASMSSRPILLPQAVREALKRRLGLRD